MAGIKIEHGFEAMDGILQGAKVVADVVGSTLGPKGRSVIMHTTGYGTPEITKDGVSVAKSVSFKSSLEGVGVDLIKMAGSKTLDKVGDGTTTATVLTYALMSGMIDVCRSKSVNQSLVKMGMEKARDKVIEFLKKNALPISDKDLIKSVAIVSTNGDVDLGTLIADVIDKTGRDGVVTVETGKSLETEVGIVQGLQFDKGYISPYFVNNGSTVCELSNPYILLFDGKISSIPAILGILEKVASVGREFLIVAEDVEPEVLAMLVVNKMKGAIKVCVVKSPYFGTRRDEVMEDIAIVTGGTFVSSKTGLLLDKLELSMLGSAESVKVTKDSTTIIGGKGEISDIESRMSQISAMLSSVSDDYDESKLQERRARLSGGIGVIRVGGATEVEVQERKSRIDDALRATKAAMEAGIVPGGGFALVRASKYLSDCLNDEQNLDIKAGMSVVRDAILTPTRKICENACEAADLVIDKVLSSSDVRYGYDIRSGNYCDMIESGIIDPVKVVIVALENGVSIGSTVGGSGAVIFKEHDEDSKNNGSAMPHMY